jgi:hypothetical protein
MRRFLEEDAFLAVLRFAVLRLAVLRFAVLRFGAAFLAVLRLAALRFGAAFLATEAFFLFVAMVFSFFRLHISSIFYLLFLNYNST